MNLLTKIILVFILVGGVTIAFLLNSRDKRVKAQYAAFFYYKELDGKISFITTGTMGVVRMKINNIDSVYYLSPRRSDGLEFYKLAKIGDRFIKHANDDTVQLISNDQVYKFIMSRPN